MRYAPRGKSKTKPVRPTREEVEKSLVDILPSLETMMEDMLKDRIKAEDLPF